MAVGVRKQTVSRRRWHVSRRLEAQPRLRRRVHDVLLDVRAWLTRRRGASSRAAGSAGRSGSVDCWAQGRSAVPIFIHGGGPRFARCRNRNRSAQCPPPETAAAGSGIESITGCVCTAARGSANKSSHVSRSRQRKLLPARCRHITHDAVGRMKRHLNAGVKSGQAEHPEAARRPGAALKLPGFTAKVVRSRIVAGGMPISWC